MQPLEFREQVPLAPHTTFGIGGPADYFCTPQSADELVAALAWGNERKFSTFVLGLGANILVGDRGFRGLVIKNEARHVSFGGSGGGSDGDPDGVLLTAESGGVINDLIEETTAKGLSGLEHYQNIPSTVGGAMWQNLHFLSYPHERTYFIEEIVKGATVLSGGKVKKVGNGYFEFGYDSSSLHTNGDVVLDVTLELTPDDPKEIQVRRDKNAAWREAKHPPGAVQMSAGSIFQKIEGVGAGRLIDAAGLKGYRIGGAEVSERHANYILNVGRATAADVRALIAHVQQAVKADSGYELLPEISFIGEF